MLLTCSRCGRDKPYSEFYADGKGGKKGQCIPCYVGLRKKKRKVCGWCGVEKGYESFHRDRYKGDGYRSVCTLCWNAKHRPDPDELAARMFNLKERFTQLGTTMAEEVAVCRAIVEIVQALPGTADRVPARHTEALKPDETHASTRRDHQLSVAITDAVRAIRIGHIRLADLPYTEDTREEAA